MANIDIIIRMLRSGSGGTATAAELKALESQAVATGARLSAMGGAMMRTGAMMSLATAPLLAFGVASVKAASDAAESLNKLDVVFEDNARAVQTWAQDSARQFGLSRAQAYDAASSFGAMFKSMNMGQEPMIQMSEGLVQIAADLGSLYNADPSDMLNRLRSGMVGEAEPLRRFGILLDESAVSAQALQMGLAATAGQLTQADKVQARYALIVQQSAVAQGDFARTSDGLANSTRIARARMADAAATMGTALIPMATTAAQQVTALATAFSELDPEAQKAVVTLGGLLVIAGPLTTALGALAKVAGVLAPIIASIGVAGAGGLGLIFGAEAASVVYLAKAAAETTPAMRNLAMAEMALAAADQERARATSLLAEVTLTGDAATIAQAQSALDAANAQYEHNRALAEGLRATVAAEQASKRYTDTMREEAIAQMRAAGSAAVVVAESQAAIFTRESAILATLTGSAADAGVALAKTLTDIGNAAVMGPLSDAQMEKWRLIGELIRLNNADALKLKDTYAQVALLISPGQMTKAPGYRAPYTPSTAGMSMPLYWGTVLYEEKKATDLAVDRERRKQEALTFTQNAAERVLARIQERLTALADAVTNAINDARSKAKGLFDLSGGGGVVTEPGKGGPFEALYRILAVASEQAGRGTAPETQRWREMYPAVDYTAISRAFQEGMLLAPGVFENIDWRMLGEQAAAGVGSSRSRARADRSRRCIASWR